MNMEQALLLRSNSKCELCTSEENLMLYEVPPVDVPDVDRCIMLCSHCHEQIVYPANVDVNHWRCLNSSMWSDVVAVKVMV